MASDNDYFRFSHAKIQEVVYGDIPVFRKRKLHQQLARILEDEQVRTSSNYSAAIARHYLAADDQEKALGYLLQAGKRNASLYVNKEALSCFEDALVIIERLPTKAGDTEKLKLDALIGIALVYRATNQFERADSYYIQAIELTRSLKDKDLEIFLFSRRAEISGISGQYEKGRELCDQAMKIALETGNLQMLSQLFNDFADLDWWLFVQYEAQGKRVQATEAGERILANASQAKELAEKTKNQKQLMRSYKNLGTYYESVHHDYMSALNMYEKSAAIALDPNLKLSKYVLQKVGQIYRVKGMLEKAHKLYEQYLAWAQGIGARWAELKGFQCLGITEMEQGNYGEAIQLYNSSLELNQSVKAAHEEIETRVWKGVALELQGKQPEAFAEYREALKVLGNFDEHDSDTEILLKVGRILYSNSELPYATKYLHRCLEAESDLPAEQLEEIQELLKKCEIAEDTNV